MISVKSYFTAVECHREKCYLCNIESNCKFLVKFCKKKIAHNWLIVSHHAKAITKKKLGISKKKSKFAICS